MLRRALSVSSFCLSLLAMSSLAGALPISNPGEVASRVVSEVSWVNPAGQIVTIPVPTTVVQTPNGLQLMINGGNPFQFSFGTGPPELRDTVIISGGGYLDPVQTFAVAFTDFGAPGSFTFSLSTPMVPAFGGSVFFTGDLSGSFTDGGTDGGSVSPFGGTTIARFDLNGVTVLGVGAARTYDTPSDSQTDPHKEPVL